MGGMKSAVWGSERKEAGRQDSPEAAGKAKQADVDACAVQREAVGVPMHEGAAKHEVSAG